MGRMFAWLLCLGLLACFIWRLPFPASVVTVILCRMAWKPNRAAGIIA